MLVQGTIVHTKEIKSNFVCSRQTKTEICLLFTNTTYKYMHIYIYICTNIVPIHDIQLHPFTHIHEPPEKDARSYDSPMSPRTFHLGW